MERLYTAAEAADRLNVSVVMIWEWTREGKLGCHKIGKGRNIRISQKHIDAFLENSEQKEKNE